MSADPFGFTAAIQLDHLTDDELDQVYEILVDCE